MAFIDSLITTSSFSLWPAGRTERTKAQANMAVGSLPQLLDLLIQELWPLENDNLLLNYGGAQWGEPEEQTPSEVTPGTVLKVCGSFGQGDSISAFEVRANTKFNSFPSTDLVANEITYFASNCLADYLPEKIAVRKIARLIPLKISSFWFGLEIFRPSAVPMLGRAPVGYANLEIDGNEGRVVLRAYREGVKKGGPGVADLDEIRKLSKIIDGLAP